MKKSSERSSGRQDLIRLEDIPGDVLDRPLVMIVVQPPADRRQPQRLGTIDAGIRFVDPLPRRFDVRILRVRQKEDVVHP